MEFGHVFEEQHDWVGDLDHQAQSIMTAHFSPNMGTVASTGPLGIKLWAQVSCLSHTQPTV